MRLTHSQNLISLFIFYLFIFLFSNQQCICQTKEDLLTKDDLLKLVEAKIQSIVTPVSFSPDGKKIAYSKGIEIQIWDVTSGKLLRTLKGIRVKLRNQSN